MVPCPCSSVVSRPCCLVVPWQSSLSGSGSHVILLYHAHLILLYPIHVMCYFTLVYCCISKWNVTLVLRCCFTLSPTCTCPVRPGAEENPVSGALDSPAGASSVVVAPVGVAPAGVSPVGVSPAGVSPGPLGPPDRGQTWWPWRCSGSNACK